VESFWEILVDFQQQKVSPALLLVASFYMFLGASSVESFWKFLVVSC
jgi:hypothetical protein